MKSGNPVVAVFDTKPYDREYLGRPAGSGELELRFHEFRLWQTVPKRIACLSTMS